MAKAKEKGVLLFLSSTMLYRRETQYIQAAGGCIRQAGALYLPYWPVPAGLAPVGKLLKTFCGQRPRPAACASIFGIDLPWLLDAFGDVTHVTVQEDSISDLGLPYPDCVTLLLRHASGARGCAGSRW